MATIKIDGREIPFEQGDTIIRAAHRAGIDIPHYCWHPGLSVAANCRMCLVEVLPAARPPRDDARHPPLGRGKRRLRAGEEAEALARVPADLRARDGGALGVEPQRGRGAQRGPGAPAPEPPGRLPHLRPGRRVPPAGLLARARPQAEAHARGAGAQAQGRRLRAHHRLRRRALHRLHALRPRHGRAGARSRPLDPRARQPGRGHRLPRAPARQRLHADDRARLPGRRAHVVGLPLQGARLVPPQRADRLPGLRHRLQRLPRLRPAQQHARTATARARTWRSTSTGCATRACSRTSARSRAGSSPRSSAATTPRSRTRSPPPSTSSRATERTRRSVAVVLSAQHSNEDNFAMVTLAKTYLGAGDFYVSGRPLGRGDDILMSDDKNPNTRGVMQIASTTPPRPIAELLDAIDAGTLRLRHRARLRARGRRGRRRARRSPSSRAW